MEVKIVGGPLFSIKTTETLQINGIISGQPDPNITLYKIENGREVIISNDHLRITIVFIATRFTITIEDVCVNDSGVYRMKAANEIGGSSTDFNSSRGNYNVMYVYMNNTLVFVFILRACARGKVISLSVCHYCVYTKAA